MRTVLANRALRRLACTHAAPERFFCWESAVEFAADAVRNGATNDDLKSAIRAGRWARKSEHRYGSKDPVVIWSKGRDFGDCEEWAHITENARVEAGE